MYVNFKVLRQIIKDDQYYRSVPSTQNADVLREFNAMLANLIEKSHRFSALDLAYNTKAFQEWIVKSDKPTAFPNWDIKEIYFADLGIVYGQEFNFSHPVLIIEKVGDLALVVPCSTNQDKVKLAYHPIENPEGDLKMRLVKISDGFENDSALLISSLRAISPSRFHEKKGIISSKTFIDIKEQIFQVVFPKQFTDYRNLRDKENEWKAEKEHMQEAINNLERKIMLLNSEKEVAVKNE